MVADHEGQNTTFPKESKDELTLALAEVNKWEKEQKDLWIWERFSRLPFKILDRLTPKFIHDKLGKALDELGSYIQHGGRYLVSDESIYRLLQEKAQRTENLPKDTFPLPVMDAVSEDLASSRSKFATVQGATTGFGGIFTLAVDIPAVLGLALKVIQEIGLCYGYDPNLKEERVFTVKVMQFASSDIVGKRAILDELNTYVMAGQASGQGEDTTVSRIQGWHEVITLYRDNWGWKKLFQMVPIAGMIFGAYINRGMLLDVAEAARMLYRKRRILTRLAELEKGSISG
ncbi:hypothetical protein BVG16_22060 [Paenibacillus selenitireducens]|uniref:EcsC family protein n=1 Tax=Paenibacillus selenitireducens TaxID=1324314 RepID=A0A1T2X5W4_9BACL|nr:EcsC family protein [Paenibacillus selenitireducens]OPA75284.1 hypothetical protein BVG16_22060 [Paenibacillus selenitireducens]